MKKNVVQKKKSELYGINIVPMELFTAYYMKKTKLIDGEEKIVKKNEGSDKVNLVKIIKINKWILFYEENKDDNEGFIIKKLKDASKKYNIQINDPSKKIKMPLNANASKWINEANKYFGEGKRDYDFAIFLLGKKCSIYPKLKVHSLCTNGYISQIVKVDTLWENKIMSICSKILLQINAKLGGAIYTIKTEKTLEGKKIMIVGVVSNKHKDKNNYGTGVAMVASINDTFTDFYNKVKIIKKEMNNPNEKYKKEKEEESEEDSEEESDKEDKIKMEGKYNEQFNSCISEFIEEAIEVYKKKNKNQKPDWLIIYRQGVSLQQKESLKGEIREIDNVCLNKNILYYYILVNTKSTFKFFNKEKNMIITIIITHILVY